jgi:HTH-type transcriptional regulator/antitoxin HigA
MSKIKVIRTEQDYQEALKLVEGLISRDPDPNSAEGERLSILSTLIQDYEARSFPAALPNPIEALKFRMEQAGLRPVDLIPYIGSRSRVSEILSGKRQLTIDMVRALSEGLGIPAKVLIQETGQDPESKYQRWDIRIVKLMEGRGYFGNMSLDRYDKAELLREFFLSLETKTQPAALLRRTSYRSLLRTDRDILSAWMIRVMKRAKEIKMPVIYKPGVINLAFMRDFVKLSTQDKSPLLAQGYLKRVGIKLIVEPHLPKTYLDGATIFAEKDNPVIGMTIRHDRLDNFWFTLLHELSHVARHYGQDFDIFFDEKLQEENGIEFSAKDKEKEADEWAEEAILPKDKWEISPAKIIPSPMAAQSLANELGIDIAVVAGIIRFKHANYYYLHKIINDERTRVRHLFPEVFGNR